MKLKSHFNFNKQERSGIFYLVLLICMAQGAYFVFKGYPVENSSTFNLNTVSQRQVDSLKLAVNVKDTIKIFPFNPNFISDYKGYSLGMSIREIDRLHKFRDEDKFVNSPREFQEVTLVSDSLLKVISPYFRFPEWTRKKNIKKEVFYTSKFDAEKKVLVKDINLATAQQLQNIQGIGEKLSARIVKFRDRLGGFMVNEQLYDVYGLEAKVADRALVMFQVIEPPKVEKININTATKEEIANLVYIPYRLAEKIVEYRSVNGRFERLADLLTIDGYPKDKSARIELYLTL